MLHFQEAMPYSRAKIEETAPAVAMTCHNACVLKMHPSGFELHEHGPTCLFCNRTSSTTPVLSSMIPNTNSIVPMPAPTTQITAGSVSR